MACATPQFQLIFSSLVYISNKYTISQIPMKKKKKNRRKRGMARRISRNTRHIYNIIFVHNPYFQIRHIALAPSVVIWPVYVIKPHWPGGFY